MKRDKHIKTIYGNMPIEVALPCEVDRETRKEPYFVFFSAESPFYNSDKKNSIVYIPKKNINKQLLDEIGEGIRPQGDNGIEFSLSPIRKDTLPGDEEEFREMMLRHPECVYIAGIIEKYAFSFEKHFPDDSAFTALNLKSASGGNLTNFIIRLSNAMSIGHLETIATKETIFQVKAKYMVSYGGI